MQGVRMHMLDKFQEGIKCT